VSDHRCGRVSPSQIDQPQDNSQQSGPDRIILALRQMSDSEKETPADQANDSSPEKLLETDQHEGPLNLLFDPPDKNAAQQQKEQVQGSLEEVQDGILLSYPVRQKPLKKQATNQNRSDQQGKGRHPKLELGGTGGLRGQFTPAFSLQTHQNTNDE